MTGADVWLIGEANAAEFSAATGWLRNNAHCATFVDAAQAVAAAQPSAAKVSPASEPDLVVFCARRPGQIGQAAVEAVRRTLPLARLVALVGPWCEGELRSGRPAPGVGRIYWHQWQPRLVEEVGRMRLRGTQRPPSTATDVDVALNNAAAISPASRAALVGVVSARRSDFEALALALDVGGHHPVWIAPHDAAPTVRLDAVVVDSDADVAAAIDTLRALRSRIVSIPALVLGSFPRPAELAELAAHQPAAVLAKPFLVTDLLARLGDLLTASACDTGRSASAAA